MNYLPWMWSLVVHLVSQDLSIAGKRAGLAGERSGLFMEQIRIVKEMRDADIQRGRTGQFVRPRFMVWENVVGAFSSNKGDDFRAVLEETIRVTEPDAPDVPLPAKGKWPLADCWMGDGWSVAYRVFDAQFWGVPQRRRRIALIADFGGHAAPEILFVRESVCGDSEPGREERENTGRTAESCNDKAGGKLVYENHGQDCRFNGPLTVSQTVSSTFGMGGNNQPLVLVMATGQGNAEVTQDIALTLNCNHEQPIASNTSADGTLYRMTPLECERLQGYPDGWTDIGPWVDSTGKPHKESSDSARYKALGNSIALPPWAWVLKRLCGCYERTATMASLFDGIGGFPLIWERLNGPGSCLWASEIEEFPIAVTKKRFGTERAGW